MKQKLENKSMFYPCSKPTVYENAESEISESRGVVMTIDG